MNGSPRSSLLRVTVIQAQGQPASQDSLQSTYGLPTWGPPNQTSREWGLDATHILQPPHYRRQQLSHVPVPCTMILVPRLILSWNRAMSPKAEGEVALNQQLLHLQKEPGVTPRACQEPGTGIPASSCRADQSHTEHERERQGDGGVLSPRDAALGQLLRAQERSGSSWG